MTKNCRDGCFSACLAFETRSRACCVFAAETEGSVFGVYESEMKVTSYFPQLLLLTVLCVFPPLLSSKQNELPQPRRGNCFSFPAKPIFSELRNTRRTLLWLITRRLIDCLLICLYEKRLDKQFVQLEELSQRLSPLQNVWELVFCSSERQLVFCCVN